MTTETTDTNSIDASVIIYLGGRKYILSLLSLISASLLVYFGKISDGVYSTVMVATVAAYISGNVYQKTLTNKV